jgi:hypothetical protein
MAFLDPVASLRDSARLGRLFVGLGVPIAAAIAVFGLLDKGGLALSEKAIAAGIGLAMLAAAIRWPGAALGVVLVVVPL